MTTASTTIPLADVRRIRRVVDTHGAQALATMAHVHIRGVHRACAGESVKGVTLGALLAACERLSTNAPNANPGPQAA